MLKRLLAVMALFWLLERTHGQIPLDLLSGPVCGMVDPRTRTQVAISPAFTRVNVVITDAIAQAVVTQTFVNPFDSASEAVYVFPLPDQGSVHGMQYTYRDTLYVAEIMERVKAQQKYDSIRQNGGQAALLLQDRPNIFQQRLANIGARETAHVEIRLSMALKYADGGLELAFPTMIGPRYGSGQPAAAGSWNPPEDRAGQGLQFNVLVRSGVQLESIASPSHVIEVGELEAMRAELTARGVLGAGDQAAAAYTRGVLLKAAQTYPNRDYVLRLKPAGSGQDVSLATYRAPAAAGAGGAEASPGWFMLNLYPDASLFAGARPDLELVLLVDVSGSQAGWPLEREKEIALSLLSRLTPDDDLTVLSFSDAVQYAFGSETPVAATRANVGIAETFVRGLVPMGGTELLAAVNRCLAIPRKSDKRRYYVFLTDGFITNESAILQAIGAHPSQPTIFTFGAGNSLNRFFLEECAKVGNGFATELLQGEPAGPAVEAAWSRIEAPQLSNIRVDFGGLDTSEVIWPVSKALYRGLPYRVCGRFRRGGDFTVTLTAYKDGQPVTFTRPLDAGRTETLSWSVPKLWARERIGRLMLEQGTGEANKADIIALSLEHQVLSAYTAFLASQPQAIPSGGVATEIARRKALPGTSTRFTTTVRGGLLRLEFASPARVKAIQIFDPHGRLLFAYRPGRTFDTLGWIWDGRDAQGRLLSRGRYHVRVLTEAGVMSRTVDWNPSA